MNSQARKLSGAATVRVPPGRWGAQLSAADSSGMWVASAAEGEAKAGREACLIDLDVQFAAAEPREAEEGLDHVQKPFAGRDLHPYAGVAVARIPPVVPYARLDDGRLPPTKNAGLPVALHGQLTLEHGELLDKSGMAVFPHDLRPNERR